jgi:hypothetical protein
VTDYLQSHAPAPDLLVRADVSGFSVAFLVGAAIAGLGLLATLTMVPRGVASEPVSAEEAPEPVAA